jgi:hypothetical protein
VKAIYVNGTESMWSNYKEVLLKEGLDVLVGDADRNGIVNIEDVTAIVDYILTGTGDIDMTASDVNGNGIVNIEDVTDLVDYLLRGEW